MSHIFISARKWGRCFCYNQSIY